MRLGKGSSFPEGSVWRIRRSASNIRSAEPSGLFVHPRGGSVRWQQCRGACEVVPLESRSLTTTSRLGSVGGHCARRSKFCQRVCAVLSSHYAPHVGLGPHRLPDTVWS